MKKNLFFALIIMLVSNVGYSQGSDQNVFLLGDANEDGAITIEDALVVAQHSVGTDVPNISVWAADVDGNSVVEILDALFIAQFSVGKITSFPVHEPASLLGKWYDPRLLADQNVEEGFKFYDNNSAEMYRVIDGEDVATVSGTYTVSYNEETGRSHVVMDGKYMVPPVVGMEAYIEFDYSIVGDDLLLNQTSAGIPLGQSGPVNLELTRTDD